MELLLISIVLNTYSEGDVRNKGTCMRFHSLLKNLVTPCVPVQANIGQLIGLAKLSVYLYPSDDRMAIMYRIYASCIEPEETPWAFTQSIAWPRTSMAAASAEAFAVG